MKQKNDISHSELPLPRYVRDVLSKHNISLPSPLGEGAGVRLLALQSHRYPDIDMPYLLNQLTGWQTARTKLPSWAAKEDIIYPPHLSMEQCSSEQTAEYKAQLVARLVGVESLVSSDLNNECSRPSAVEKAIPKQQENHVQKSFEGSFCDLTGGFGVDFSFMSRRFERAIYVEQQEELCEVARHNFRALGLTQAEVVNGDGTAYLHQLDHVAVIFLDPARRNEQGGKTVLISDCTPDVLTLEEELLEKADTVVIKLSPMLDWHRAVDELNRLGNVVSEVHIVSVRNECKELLLVLQRTKGETDGKTATEKALQVFCVNDNNIVSYSLDEALSVSQRLLLAAPKAGQYLYEPNASLMKAGCFSLLTVRYSLSALSLNSHLFVSDEAIDAFPGRKFRITAVSSFNKKELRHSLSGIDKANLAVRNFPMSVAELRKRLKIKEGGDVYLFATTDAESNHLLFVCKKTVMLARK
ncbi:THUMP-like domain-containing protein [Prevotella jejuni]|uniref:THUMP-like domain-containing protein n=1 Tax=Prevotella jejuni TaxID=1177574 RepID=UPI0028DB6EA4|nr:RsmD family RNA methyltransferase [Prevotella jejuni]